MVVHVRERGTRTTCPLIVNENILPRSLTANLLLKISRAPKGKDHLPTIIFQGLCVKIRGCTFGPRL